jgi:hypothetical protein
MKYKMTAVLVALAMMFAGVFVMADGDGADADVSATISIAQGETYTTSFLLNDNAYDKSYTATPAWTVSSEKTGSSAVTLTMGTASDAIDGITYTLTKMSDGKYSLILKADTDATAEAVNHTLECKMTVKIDNNNSVELKAFDYKLAITKTSKTAVTVTMPTDFVKGEAKSAEITVSGITLSDYDWYAIGLPEGLGMSKSGTVSGIVTADLGNETSKTYNVTLTAFEKTTDGKTTTMPVAYYGIASTMTVKNVTASTVTLTFTGGKIITTDTTAVTTMTFSNIGEGLTPSVSPSGTVVVEQGETVSFTTSLASTDIIKVVAVDESTGAEKELTSTYSLTPAGTGSYKVIITANVGGTNATLTFNLLVLANTHGDWSPAIVINGN